MEPMYVTIIMYCLHQSVISVGFEAALIQTQEDVGNVLVIGVELSDLTEVPLTVSINTQDNTATGITVLHIIALEYSPICSVNS